MNAAKKRPVEADNDNGKGLEHLVNPTRKKLKPEHPLELSRLVDISDLENTSQEAIQARFESIANIILCDYDLVVGLPSSTGTITTSYQVLELEFYLWMDDMHEDPFTHGSEEQRVCGQWYFHRTPKRSTDSHRSLTSLASYRGGSRKGLDLTIGRRASISSTLSSTSSMMTNSRFFPSDPATSPGITPTPSLNSNLALEQSTKDIRGGILLRTLRRLRDLKVICGPSLLVDEILQASGATSITDLVENKWDGRDAFLSSSRPSSPLSSFLHFRSRSSSVSELPRTSTTVYRSPRIGLDLSHPGTTPTKTHPRLLYLPKPYRFFVHPEWLDKGRPQTFVGVLNRVCRELNLAVVDLGLALEKGKKASMGEQVTSLTNMKQSTYDKYLEDYITGLTRGAIRTYVGTVGKGAGTSPGVYLRMVGALEKFLRT